MKTRFYEFFEADNERLSMSRLLMFMGFWPASYAVIIEHTADMLYPFLTFCGGVYLGGKWADRQQPDPPAVTIQNSEQTNVPGAK